MRRPLVAGNWKMNGDTESTISLVQGIVKQPLKLDPVFFQPAAVLAAPRDR